MSSQAAANSPTFSPLTGPVLTLWLMDGATRILRSREGSKPDELWHGQAADPATGSIHTVYVRLGEPHALMAELLFATIAHALHLPAARPFLVNVPHTAVDGSGRHTSGVITAFGCEDAMARSFSVMLNEDAQLKSLLRDWDQLGEVATIDEWLINSDRNMGNLVYGNKTFTLVDHAEAFANGQAELWGLDDLIDTTLMANKLAQFAKDELAREHVNKLWQRANSWINHEAARLDVGDCIARSQIEYVAAPYTHAELSRFIEGRLTLTGSLLCQKLLGQTRLALQHETTAP